MSVMPEVIYKSSYETLSDRELVGAGDVPLMTLRCAVMKLTLAETVITEQVYDSERDIQAASWGTCHPKSWPYP